MNDYRRRARVLRLKGQPERWKRYQRWCKTERNYHIINTLGGGDFYSGLMSIDLICAQVRAFVRQSAYLPREDR
jgi:hypothetical protein